MTFRDRIGVVAIGRNEGQRLRACLQSCIGQVAAVVYVDSGSTDTSVQMAREMGVEVVPLDLTKPFTAARARNAGYARLVGSNPGIEYVQFVDGDCEIAQSWLEQAAAALAADPELAIACGRRRERFPEATIYNRLCDMEWAAVPGPTRECGGDAMIRLTALRQVGGYNAALIAGEEPEMCVRLRQKDWTILRLDAEMTRHDAAMTRFGQWWRRAVRAGHAFAEGAAMHGAPPERHKVRSVQSTLFWGALVPLLIVAGLAMSAWVPYAWVVSVLLGLGYPVLAWRIYRYRRSERHDPPRQALLYAVFTTIAKFPQLVGVIQFTINRARGTRTKLIEYKGANHLAA
jgi:glycosyltransferase involved in cell wall biosynthesis